jgi:hypothetical protein
VDHWWSGSFQQLISQFKVRLTIFIDLKYSTHFAVWMIGQPPLAYEPF